MLRGVLLNGLPSFAVVELHPIVLTILDLSSVLQCLGEQIPKIVVIRGILEAKISDVAQVLVEFLGEAITEVLDSSGLLLLSNLLVLLLVGRSLESLPWKSSSQEIHENMSQCLEIVSSRLFSAQVSVDTHVSCSTRQ